MHPLPILATLAIALLPKIGTCYVFPQETWVTAGLAGAPEGHPNVSIARVLWSKPNALVDTEIPR